MMMMMMMMAFTAITTATAAAVATAVVGKCQFLVLECLHNYRLMFAYLSMSGNGTVGAM